MKCSRCEKDKPLARNGWCRGCNAEYQRERRMRDPAAREKNRLACAANYAKRRAERQRKAREAYDPERARTNRAARADDYRMYSREYARRRAAKKRGTATGRVNYQEVLRRCGPVCHICGRKIRLMSGTKPGSLSFDHLVPIAHDGAHVTDNIAPAHLRCNMRRGAGRIAAQLRLPSA